MKTLRTRLLLAYAGLILAGFTLLALLAGRQISAGTVEDFTTSLGEQAQIVARVLADPVEEALEGEISPSALRGILQTYAEQTNATVALIDRSGRLWTSSDGGFPATDTPEIAAARDGQIGRAVRGSTAYAAAPVREDDRIIAVVQLAAPLSAAQSLVVQRWLGLAGAVLGVTAVAGAAGYWLSVTLTRPLEELRRAALAIAGGDFSRRLPEERQDEIGAVARAFNHMAGQVESTIEEQRAFAGNASHELRTPLTAIRLRSEALREKGVDEETSERYVAEIDDEARRLGDLVQDLMLLSRLDSGRLEAGRERIDPLRLARQLLDEIAPEAGRRGIVLTLDAPDKLPDVTAGQSHLALVFRNLLSNALKYTPDGGAITWRLRAGERAILHEIQDSGQGISSEDLPHLFERFYRADKSRSRTVQGVGLGLSLVKMIVDFYGGEIRIYSSGVGQGAAVYVRWPAEE